MAYRDYKIKCVEFHHNDDPEKREVVVTLDNETEIHIESCYESWQQWGGTDDELRTTVKVAERVNDWLHGIGEPPAEVYGYIDGVG